MFALHPEQSPRKVIKLRLTGYLDNTKTSSTITTRSATTTNNDTNNLNNYNKNNIVIIIKKYILVIIFKRTIWDWQRGIQTAGAVLPDLLMVIGCWDLELHRSLLGFHVRGAAESHMPPCNCCDTQQSEGCSPAHRLRANTHWNIFLKLLISIWITYIYKKILGKKTQVNLVAYVSLAAELEKPPLGEIHLRKTGIDEEIFLGRLLFHTCSLKASYLHNIVSLQRVSAVGAYKYSG